jgi:hypothetical protein
MGIGVNEVTLTKIDRVLSRYLLLKSIVPCGANLPVSLGLFFEVLSYGHPHMVFSLLPFFYYIIELEVNQEAF